MFPGVTVERVELDELAERAEVLIVLCAGGEATRGLVGESFLKKMGEGRSQGLGVVVNAARVRVPSFSSSPLLQTRIGRRSRAANPHLWA